MARYFYLDLKKLRVVWILNKYNLLDKLCGYRNYYTIQLICQIFEVETPKELSLINSISLIKIEEFLTNYVKAPKTGKLYPPPSECERELSISFMSANLPNELKNITHFYEMPEEKVVCVFNSSESRLYFVVKE